MIEDSDDEEEDYPVPVMPCSARHRHPETTHRPKRPHAHGLYNACVARPVKPAEVKTNPDAQAAMQKEWDRLRAVKRPDGTFGVWDESKVEEWSLVRKRARASGEKAHVGLVFGIVVEKNHELDPKDPLRKYKGAPCFKATTSRTSTATGRFSLISGRLLLPWRRLVRQTPMAYSRAMPSSNPMRNRLTRRPGSGGIPLGFASRETSGLRPGRMLE